MTIELRDEADDPLLAALDLAELEGLAANTLRAEGLPGNVEVALTMIDRAAMAQLNRSHLGKGEPTDVLSFPLEVLTPGSLPAAGFDSDPPFGIGDVFICPSVVADNAAASGVAFADEMALMVVHGLLHLLGYDHIEDGEAEQMEQRERELLAMVGRTRP